MHPQRRRTPFRTARTAAIAAILLAAGCVYVPTSRQFQADDKPRAETLVGDAKSGRPIVLGRTTVTDAIAVFQARDVAPPGTVPVDHLLVNPSLRQLGYTYDVVTAHALVPGGGDMKQTAPRLLVLTFDGHGIIQSATSTDEALIVAKRHGYRRLKKSDPLKLFNVQPAAPVAPATAPATTAPTTTASTTTLPAGDDGKVAR